MREQSGGNRAAAAADVLCRLVDAIGAAHGDTDVYEAALDALRDAVAVDRSSILLFDADEVMRFKAWRGLSSAYRAAVEGHSPWRPDTPDPRPIAVGSVRDDPSLQPFLGVILDEGIEAMLFIPLTARGRVIGKFMCYAGEPRDFAGDGLALAVAVAQQVAFAVSRSASEMECARLAAQGEFLADLTAALNRTLDYNETLETLAQLAVPRIGDLSILHIRGDDGVVRPRAVAHADPKRAESLAALLQRHPYDEAARGGVGEVMRSGRSARIRIPSSEEVAAARVDSETDAALRAIRICSAMVVALKTSSAVLGTMTIAATEESGREYGAQDLVLAEEIAARAAIAIENARLYRLAQDANRQKDEFLATLSHELRTPLNAVLGWARMLEDGRLTPERAQQAITTIRRNAEAQARLIADILDVARIVSGKLQLDLREGADVSTIVGTATQACQSEADRRGVTLTTAIDPGLESTVDPARLQQIVWNLVSNAIKFTPAGGHVETTLRFEGNGVTLQVVDDGAGIDPSFLPHLFQRFRQADPSTTRAHSGLGLGLAIARHLAELHGGSIHAASAGPGQGSTFTVRLPGAMSGAARASEERSRTVRGRSPNLAGRRLLVVDDDPDARHLLAAMLGDAGAQVGTAASAREALTELERDGWDMLIADIAMPGEDGFDLLHRVRAMGTNPQRLPAIAVTAHARDDDRRRALLAGFQGHLAKPVDQYALLDLVASTLARRNAAT